MPAGERFRGCLRLFDEILVVENVRRRTDQPEADPHVALIAGREGVAAMHYHFVRLAVRMIVDHLINPGFRYRHTRNKGVAVPSARPELTATLAGILGQ